MFSGLFSSVQSPKSLFASKLAGALATYFEVDPAAVEASLLHDARIVLRDVDLVPQNCGGGALLVGRVAAIELAWRWGGSADGATAFVRETILSIRGASLRLRARAGPPPIQDGAETAAHGGDDAPAPPAGYMDRVIQQILDHLTLNITDVEISVEGAEPETGKMVLEAKALQLLSFGRKEESDDPDGVPAPCLSQRLSLGSFQAYILDGVDQVRHPLIDPFAYATSVRRVSGRRFLNFANGLEVIGEFCGSNDLVIHAGSKQVAVLSKITDELLSVVTIPNSPKTSPPEGQFKDKAVPVETTQAQPVSASTHFSLPFPSLVLCLPKGAKIRLPRCVFHYRMDGSEFSLEGSEGILVNDCETPLLQMMNSAIWNIDFGSSKFLVSPSTDGSGSSSPAEATVSQMMWDEENMKLVINSLLEMQRQGQSLIDRAVEESAKSDFDTDSLPWSFAISGQLAVNITGKNDEWVRMSVDSPEFSLADAASPPGRLFSSGGIAGAKIGPTSFGNATVQVPSFDLSSGGDLLSFQTPIQIDIPSASVLTEIQAFVGRLADIELDDSPETGVQAASATLPFAVEIPAVVAALSEPKSMKVQVKGIRWNRDCTAKIESVSWSEESKEGMAGSMVGISLLSAEKPEVHVARVESLRVPGAAELTVPVEGFTVKFVDEQLYVDLPIVNCRLCSAATTPESSDEPGKETAAVLPFPLHLSLEKLSIQSNKNPKKVLSVSPVRLSASPDEKFLSIETKKTVNVRLESSADDWLNACVERASVSLANETFLPTAFSCGGIRVGPCSCGDVFLDIPNFQLTEGSDEVCLEGVARCNIHSVDVVSSIRAFVEAHLIEILGVSTSSSEQQQLNSSPSAALPFAVKLPTLQVSLSFPKPINAQLEGIQINRDNTATIKSACCGGSDGISGSIFGVSLLSAENPALQIARVESLHIPGAAKLTAPVEGVSIKYEDEQLFVNLPAVSCVLCNATTGPTSSNDDDLSKLPGEESALLPFPVHLRLEKLCIYSSKDPQKQISAFPVYLSASPVQNRLSIETKKPVIIHLEASAKNWIDAGFENAFISLDNGTFEPKSFRCAGIQAGPYCSYGEASLDIPSFQMAEGSQEVCFEGAMRCKIQSLDVASSIQDLVVAHLNEVAGSSKAAQGSKSGSMSAKLPEASLEILESGTRVAAHGILVDMARMSCDRLVMSDSRGASGTASGIRVNGLTECTQIIALDWIDALFLPGIAGLTKPVADSKITYTAESGLYAELLSVSATLADDSSTAQTPSELAELPFPVHCSLGELLLEMKAANGGVQSSNIRGLQVDANPVESTLLLSETQGSTKVHVSATVDHLENDLVKASKICASGIYGPSNVIANLRAQVGTAAVSTGFSSVEWSQLFGTDQAEKKKVVWMLPHAQIARFKSDASYKGKVLSTETVLHMPSFSGDSATTLDNIMAHYSTTAMQQMPSLISGASVLGENAVDMGARNVGSMALRKTVAGSVGGSVGGLVAVDSIRGAIQSGKKARGASEDDRYHFGDFSKGLIRSVKETAKSGGSERRGDGHSYEVGDLSVGAAASIGKYAGNNKERLGSAGGSSLGMTIGAVALGPIGLVAGSILGAKAGAKAFASSEKSAEPSDQEQSGDSGLQKGDGQSANLLDDPWPSSSPQPGPYPHDPFEPNYHHHHHQLQQQQQQQQQALSQTSYQQHPTSSGVNATVQAGTQPFLDVDDPLSIFSSNKSPSPPQPNTQQPDPFQLQAQAPLQTGYQQQQKQQPMHSVDDPLSVFSSANSPSMLQSTHYQPPTVESNYQQPAQSQYNTTQPYNPQQHLHNRSQGNYQQQQPAPSQYNYQQQQQAAPSQYSYQQQLQTNYQQQQATSSPYSPQQQQQQQRAAPAHANVNRQQQQQQQQQQRQAPVMNAQATSTGNHQGYRFGDVTRSVVAKGKKTSGRSEQDGYRFGDFSRGLFGGKK